MADIVPGAQSKETVTVIASVTVNDTASAPVTDPPLPQVVHLADLKTRPRDIIAASNMSHQVTVGIDGKQFDYGWVTTFGTNSNPPIMMGINTKRAYSRFTARLGVRDISDPSQAKIEVIADGTTIFSELVSLQNSYDVDLPISNIQRLEIKGYAPTPASIIFAVGDPVLMP